MVKQVGKTVSNYVKLYETVPFATRVLGALPKLEWIMKILEWWLSYQTDLMPKPVQSISCNQCFFKNTLENAALRESQCFPLYHTGFVKKDDPNDQNNRGPCPLNEP